ncbi:MAG: T9SS type A sorting domain-containing protein [Ignavibacteriaceae bacterium]
MTNSAGINIMYNERVTISKCILTTDTMINNQTDGIYSQDNIGNIYEYNNIVISNRDTGGHDDCIQSYSDYPLIIRNNYCEQNNSKSSNAQGIYITAPQDNSDTTRIYNNIFNATLSSSNGISYKAGGSSTARVQIIGNTVYGENLSAQYYITDTFDPIIKNNIGYSVNGHGILRLHTVDFSDPNYVDYNIWKCNDDGPVSINSSGKSWTYWQSLGFDLHSYITNPQFNDILNNDFTLQVSSDCIDNGQSLYPPYNIDYNDSSRPKGEGWDIGAYESDFFTISLPNDFTIDFLVQDNCSNSNILKFGTNSNATDCFDSTYDILASPQPSSSEYDSRFKNCGEDLIKDIRATNTDGSLIWDVYYQPTTGCDPVSFSWSTSEFPPDGNFYLVDPNGGGLVNINMRQDTTFTDNFGLNYLQILFNYNYVTSIDINTGWNMVSLPLVVEDSYYKSLFPNAIDGTLFGFSGSYYGSDTIKVEKGYWLKFNTPEVVNIEGIEISQMELDLASGWNMIGGPACELPFSSVEDPGGIIIPGTLFGFNGAYYSADTVVDGLGYWIKTNSPGTITLSCVANDNLPKGNKREMLLADLTDFVTINLEDSEGNHQNLYFGGKLGNNVSIESYSLPPLPPSNSFDARISGGFRLSESEEVEIEIQSDSYPLSVKVTGTSDGNLYGYLIKEYAGDVQVGEREISDAMELLISNTNVKLIKILKGSVIPFRFVLEQNYPNPFNPSTMIKYVLPVKANVTLKIINSLGQEISTLVKGEKQAGIHEVEFNATNLASGIYFYRLKVGNLSSGSGNIFVETKKMVLIR